MAAVDAACESVAENLAKGELSLADVIILKFIPCLIHCFRDART